MTRKFTFLLMALLALAGFKSWGQEAETITIGTGTGTVDDMPFNSYYNYSYAQMLYLGSEIGESGTITSISFDATKSAAFNMNLDVYMKCVDRESYSNSNDWESVSSENLVYQNQNYNASSTGWITFTLDKPFQYDKSKNLMIAFDNNTGSYYAAKAFHYTTTSGNTCIYLSNDGTNVDPLSPIAGNAAVWRPNIKITIEPTVSCPKPTGLTASNITATGATISWNGDDAESYDLAYGVASTFDLSNPDTYTVEESLLLLSRDLTDLLAETEYKCAVKAHCSDEEESAWSSVITFMPSAFSHLTVNDGTYVNTNNDSGQVPFNGYNADNYNNKSQFIIPASALEQMADASITDITFYLNTNSSNKEYTYDIFDIYVKEVDYTTVGYTYPEEFASMTKVYTGKLTTSNYQLTIHFDEPYVYGGQNLMVGFSQTSRGTWGYTYWLGKEEGTEMRSRSGYSNSYGSTVNSYTFLPKTTFTYLPGATYTVTVTQPEEGGTISADPTTDVTAGTTVTLSATPTTGYGFGEWTVTNTTTSETITVTDNQFTMPESDVTVTATFEALVPHTVTIADGIQHGTVRLFEGDPTQYIAGETVRLEVTADEGYFYPNEDEITVTDAAGNNIDVIIDAPNYSFIMPNSNVTVHAVFNLYYGVQVDESIVGGFIGATSDFENFYTPSFFTAGTNVYFIPTPHEDYEYAEQSVRVYEWDWEQEITGDPIPVDYNSGYAHITMPETDIFVTATFNRTKYNVTEQIVNPSESGYFYMENYDHITVGDPVVISDIIPFIDYQFASVSVTRNDNQATVETYPYNDDYVFYMPDSDVTVTVNFEAIPYYTVSIIEPEHGDVYLLDGSSYHAGHEVILAVYPDDDYIISATDITIIPDEGEPFHPTYSYDYHYTFNMPASNVTITAAFREIQTYTINYYVNGKFVNSALCKEDEAIDIYTYEPIIPGVSFEGWGVDPIDTYVTEIPAIISWGEYPTHDYDLYAVLSYTEYGSAAKSGEVWEKVTSTSELTAGDEIVFVYDNLIMCNREGATYQGYPTTDVTITDNEITSLPSNTAQFTLVDNNGYWKLQYDELGATRFLATSSSSYDLASDDLYQSWSSYGYDVLVNWTAVTNNNSVVFRNDNINYYIGYNSYYSQMTMMGLNYACQAYKKGASFITTTYYMTEVLTSGTVASATAKNIIVVNPITVSGRLEMNAEGLFRNEDAANFVFADGAEFYYTGEETVLATFEKTINAYTGDYDNYYFIANPTDEENVDGLGWEGFDLYTFNAATDGEGNEWINEGYVWNTDIERGTGYLYANQYGTTLSFAGELIPANSPDYSRKSLILAAAGEGRDFPGFNLIGNPFACNVYLDKPAYLLDGGEYQPIAANTAIAPCEGFFVEAESDGENLSISTSDPGLRGNSISLTVSQNRGNVIDRAIVSFDGSSNLHKFMLNPAHTNIRLAKNGEEFAALNSDAEGEIPVSFKAEKNGSYTITVNAENVEANYLHLVDNMTGMDVDLLSTPSYTFNASTSDYAYRFKLVFNMNIDEANGSNANSFAYISNGNLVIDNIEGEATMQIVDMLGRVISTETVSGSYNKALNLNAGLYIINLNGMTQKIVVK